MMTADSGYAEKPSILAENGGGNNPTCFLSALWCSQ